MTRHYEDARYGELTGAGRIERMRDLYRLIFWRVAR